MSDKDDAIQVITGVDGKPVDITPGTIVIGADGEMFCVQEDDTNVVPVDNQNRVAEGVTVIKPEKKDFVDEKGNKFSALVFKDDEGNLKQVVKDKEGNWFVLEPDTNMLYADGHTEEVGNKIIRVNEENMPIDANGKPIGMVAPVEDEHGNRKDDVAEAMKRDSQQHFGVIKSKSALQKLYERITGAKSEPEPKAPVIKREAREVPSVQPQIER